MVAKLNMHMINQLTQSQRRFGNKPGSVSAVSNDGGVTWRGLDADGNILANVLNAIGINAEWIKVLTSFTVGEHFSVNQFGQLVASDAINGTITSDEGKIAGMDITQNGFKKEKNLYSL